LAVKDVANHYLNAKMEQRDSGELSPRTFNDYKLIIDGLVAGFGKGRLVADLGPSDFASLRTKLSKTNGPARLSVIVQVIRSAFKFAFDSDLLDRPVRTGPQFKQVNKKTMRLHKAKQGVKLFSAEEIRALVEGALVVGKDGPQLVQPCPQLKAMFLLGINCGFGNSDCGRLPLSAINLDTGWVNFPRPKTGLPRRCPLWPETVQAIKDALAARPEPKNPDNNGLVFVTPKGLPWATNQNHSAVGWATAKLLRRLGINGHRNFYTLRHTFRTVADESRDQPAADHVMGHEVAHMSVVYRERISDERLRAVTDYVRQWLFGGQG
jgi:integrase